MTPLSALPIAAAALSLPLAWRTPAHRPLSVALVAAQALEALRPALPPDLAWGVLLALPALSAWAVAAALVPVGEREHAGRIGAAFGGWVAATVLSTVWPWSGWWPLALATAVAAQGAAWWRWRADREAAGMMTPWELEARIEADMTEEDIDRMLPPYLRRGPVRPASELPPVVPSQPPPSASELAALVLAAGDAGGLLVGLAAGWAAVGWWAAAVASVIVGVQARAIWAGAVDSRHARR